jgi:DUF1365 family protein
MSASALYEGTVRHRRFAVRRHELRHRVALAYLDLAELDEVLGGLLVRARPGVVRFRRADHPYGAPELPLADAIRARVAEHTGRPVPDGPVRLLCQLRTFGHCFNPVTFAYCFDGDERLQAVAAEVTSTPWGERHVYVVAREDAGDATGAAGAPRPAVLRGTLAKALHVSPFMPMDQRYDWRAAVPGETLSVHIASEQGGATVFDATLSLRRRPLTRASLARTTARLPAASLRVLALIYGHAAALRLKGVRLQPRPEVQA